MPTKIHHDGETYRYRALCAEDQAFVLDVVRPVISELKERRGDTPEKKTARYIEAAVRHAHDLSEAEIARILRITLDGAEWLRSDEPQEWVRVWDGATGDAIGDHLDGILALSLAFTVAKDSLARYLAYEPIEFEAARSDRLGYSPVAVPGNLLWLHNPTLRGLVRFESLRDGTVDLADIALLNDLLAVEAENSFRANKAAEEDAASRTGR